VVGGATYIYESTVESSKIPSKCFNGCTYSIEGDKSGTFILPKFKFLLFLSLYQNQSKKKLHDRDNQKTLE